MQTNEKTGVAMDREGNDGDMKNKVRSIQEHYEASITLATLAKHNDKRVESMATVDAEGKVLAEDCVARIPVPPFSNSAMDGFLVHRDDVASTPVTLPVVADIPAGAPTQEVPHGCALRIMTGAAVPENHADLLVIPVENTNIAAGPQPLPEEVTVLNTTDAPCHAPHSAHSSPTAHETRSSSITHKTRSSSITHNADASPTFHVTDMRHARLHNHIREQGKNICIGQVVAHAGDTLDAGLIAALLSTGITEVRVRKALSIAVVTSGDELLEPHTVSEYLSTEHRQDGCTSPGQLRHTSPGQTGHISSGQERMLPHGKIPDSNGPMVQALLHHAGFTHVTLAHTSDQPDTFRALMERLSTTHDVIVTTGGVSAGAFDVTHQVAAEKNVWFGSINMKPGKPQGLGMWNNALLFCLPGNPVAAWVSTQLFVLPALTIRAGGKHKPARVLEAIAGENFPTPGDRAFAVPVRLSTDAPPTQFPTHDPQRCKAFPYAGAGILASHYVGSLGAADGIVMIPQGCTATAGNIVNVILI